MQSTSVFMCCQVCLCVIERTIGVWTSVKVLCHERDMGKWPSLSNSSFAWRWSFGLLNGDRPIDAVGRPTIFVFHFGRTQIRGARHWGGKSACMAFFFGLRTVFVSRSDRRRKESKQTPVFVRSLDGRKQKKKSASAVDARSKIDQTQGRASSAIDRAPAPERPRLRHDLQNRRPGSPWLRQSVSP